MKFITKTFLAILIFALGSANTFAFYSDVETSNQYYEAIKSLYESGELPETTNFQPNEKITTDGLKEILESYGNQELDKTIKIESWRKDKALTKHQTLSTIFNTLGLGTSHFFDKDNFPFQDLSPDSHVGHIAQKSYEIGIYEDQENMFQMAKNVTRAETAYYIYKVKQFDPTTAPKQVSKPQTVTIQLSPSTYTAAEQELLNNPNFKTFLDVWSKLKTDYYYKGEADFNKLILNAIEGLVKDNGDIYTVFQKPSDAQKFFQTLSNEYEGVGMSLELIDENITIVSPFIDSPAEKAGLKPGDIITKVDGEDVRGQNLQTVVNKIKGKANTKVNITVIRGTTESTHSVTRQLINYKDIQYKIIEQNSKKIGYIQITTFSQTTYGNFVAAIEDLNSQNVNSYIIDLRNNPGGYLDSAVHIIGSFIGKEKTAVKLHYANGNEEIYTTKTDKVVKDLPVKILINKGSASASEILAGALKDYQIGESIGATSFGKGSVQQLYTYKDGSLFKFTIAKWFTPNGNSIDKTGLVPTRTVEKTEGKDDQLDTAVNLLVN